jgi:ribosomal protein S12 methylthiotransferase
LYGYPSLVSDELLEAIGSTAAVCRYLDVPVQHSHPDVLLAMRRGGTAKDVASMPTRIREYLPDVVLRTTCLVGFPGETESHFQHLLDYCRDAQFDHLGAFVFSPEEGTPAFDMPDIPPLEVAEDRYARLMAQQRDIVASKHKALYGKTDRILVEQCADVNPRAGAVATPGSRSGWRNTHHSASRSHSAGRICDG